MGFAKGVILDNKSFDIYFDKINTVDGVKFFVFAKEKHGNGCWFNMERKNGEWRIIDAPKVPEVFIFNEEWFSETINENFSG